MHYFIVYIFIGKLVLQQMGGHSKLGRKHTDKAKEAAVKAKGQKPEDSKSEGKKKSKKDPSILESVDFWPLTFSAASLALSLDLRPSLL